MNRTLSKKLIEVALPLPEINDAAAHDKMPGVGSHPKGLHYWWARLPLPAARAVLFASVVDDPSAHPDKWPTESEQARERERLFNLLRRMMTKKLHENAATYSEIKTEILTHTDGKLPAVFDPFAGGGSIPLEAARLGFESHARDLNPVAVLLNQCNLKLSAQWLNKPPVNPNSRDGIGGSWSWQGTRGLAADLRHYGEVIRRRAGDKLGSLYPKFSQPSESADILTWIWARTVASPDPSARGRHVPLVSSFMLSTKKGKEAWVEVVRDEAARDGWRFAVHTGTPNKEQLAQAKFGTRAGKAQDFICALTGTPIERTHIQAEGKAGRLGARLMAIVVAQKKGKGYRPPDDSQEHLVDSIKNDASLESARSTFLSGPIPNRAGLTGGVCSAYGLSTWGHLFTDRQLLSLLTLSDLIKGLVPEVRTDAGARGLNADDANAYAIAVISFLALALDRCADFNSALSTWKPSGEQQMHLFTRQALPMVWDFAEANILGEKAICWHNAVEITANSLEALFPDSSSVIAGTVRQEDAASGARGLDNVLVSTDPPYYNNISYAVLSDFFYVWLRRTIGEFYPGLFDTVFVPKLDELTAAADRFGGDKRKARDHFQSGFHRAFVQLRGEIDPRFPLTVYYAFKQEDEDGEISDDGSNRAIDLTTGWETLLEALISSGFQITATWPIRASQKWRLVSVGANALASYILLACRPRSSDALQIASSEFRRELKATLPVAVRQLQQGNIAPVDLAQASLGPGMAVFSKYRSILDNDGKAMTVRQALAIINQVLTEILTESEDEFDSETRWAIAWFEQCGFGSGDYGDAELLSKAKVTSLSAMQQMGIIESRASKVRLLRPDELPNLDGAERRASVWRATHRVLRAYFYDQSGDESTAAVLRSYSSMAEEIRELAYRLFSSSEKKKLSSEAQGYNALVLGWPELMRLAGTRNSNVSQAELFGDQ